MNVRRFPLAVFFSALALCCAGPASAGSQSEEALSPSVKALLQRSIADRPAVPPEQGSAAQRWVGEMSQRLGRFVPDAALRDDLLQSIHYEARRAGLDPEMVLGLIEVESGFRKYAVSPSGARGYMQVMPFWVKAIGAPEQNLFHLRTNLRYGCTILRHYLDIERGDLFRALGRYNGSLGQPDYPARVQAAWQRHWLLSPLQCTADRRTRPAS